MLVILNLIVIEALLSLDNSAVLATMVGHLEGKEKKAALTYGLLGAYFFRGLLLLFASFIVKIAWLKVFGGLYLIYLAYSFFKGKGGDESQHSSGIFQKWFGVFWGTVVGIELVDLTLSLDNVLAAVALSNNLWYVIAGCFIGIAALRFASGIFIKAIERFPLLESVAFGVIGALGLKLVLSYVGEFVSAFAWVNSHATDTATSVLTIIAFLVPVVLSYVRKNKKAS